MRIFEIKCPSSLRESIFEFCDYIDRFTFMSKNFIDEGEFLVCRVFLDSQSDFLSVVSIPDGFSMKEIK